MCRKLGIAAQAFQPVRRPIGKRECRRHRRGSSLTRSVTAARIVPVNNDHRIAAERVLGYAFKNEALLKESLTHASIAHNRLHSNERMEFLGDAVLDLIICHDIYDRFPTLDEG